MKLASRRLRWVILVGLAAAGVLTLLMALGVVSVPGWAASRTEKAAPTGSEPVAVTVAPVTARPIRRTVAVVGTFFGQEEVVITPKVEGRVVRLHHDTGDVVKPGDVLLEIEDVDYKLAVAEAQRALELELAKLGLSVLPEASTDWNQIPTVARARAVEENARIKFDRAQKLRGTLSLAQEDVDQMGADYRVAQASRDQAIMEAQATLAAARHKQALLETARLRLAETKVFVPRPSRERMQGGNGAAYRLARPRQAAESRAGSLPDRENLAPTGPPHQDGDTKQAVEYVVAQRMVSEGEMVRAFPSVAAFRLVMDRALKLMATVPERHVGEVKVGQPVDIRVEAYPGEGFQGTVARVNPTVDRANRTFQIEVHVPNDARRLKAGSFAKGSIFTREEAAAPTVPEEALVTFAGVIKVFAVRDGKAQAVRVEPGARLDIANEGRMTSWLEVRGELPPGTPVVTTGHSQLAEGTPVRVR